MIQYEVSIFLTNLVIKQIRNLSKMHTPNNKYLNDLIKLSLLYNLNQSTPKKSNQWRWGDGSLSEALAKQAWEPENGFPRTHTKVRCLGELVTPALWSSLTSQFSRTGKILSQKEKKGSEEQKGRHPEFTSSLHRGAHTHLNTDTFTVYTHTHTFKQPSTKSGCAQKLFC